MRRTAYILLPLALLIIAAAVFENSISADSNDLGKLIGKKNLTINIENKKTSFTLLKYQNGDSVKFMLEKRTLLGNSPSIALSGFEEDPAFCADKTIKMSDKSEAICLVGDAGVHSRNIQIIKYSNNVFADVKIFDGSELINNISSDVPNFSFADRNNDGLADLVVDERDYDTDPVANAIRSYYINTSSGFVFDEKENITYNKE